MRRVPSAVHARLRSHADVTLYDGPFPSTLADLAPRLSGTHALICLLTDAITADVLAAGPDLAIVANIAVGYNNIDVAAAKSRGIVVTNTPDVLTDAVAEFTWGLILACTRRIAEGDRLVRRGEWKGWALDFMLGMELKGKQLGIIGRGRIGRAVAARAPAFGMRAVFAERPPSLAESSRASARQAPPSLAESSRASARQAEGGGASLAFDELLVSSDVISVHAPATPETTHLFGRREFARMKRSAFLVNTGRGSIVDEDALAWALGEHLIAGAALDVYEREPAIVPALAAMENVVLAPHLGSATRETRTAMADLAVSNVLAVLRGDPPLTPV